MSNTIINKYLARREFIKGLAGVGLLSSVQMEQLFAQTVTAPLRFCFIPLQHGWGTGVQQLDGIKGADEYNFSLPVFWKPFEAIRSECLFIDGLRGTFWGNAHDDSYADILTAAAPVDGRGTTVGPSIDFLLEQKSGKPALRSCVGYNYNVSFNDRFEPLPHYATASECYDALFKNLSSGSPPVTNVDPVVKELFPYLSAEANQVLQTINTSNTAARNRLLSYLDAVTAVNTRVNPPQTTVAGTAKVVKLPPQKWTIKGHMGSNLDMVRVAFTNDTHRVAVVGMGEEAEEFTWTDSQGQPRTGVKGLSGNGHVESFHQNVAHYSSNASPDSGLAYIGWTQYCAQIITDFVKDLQNTTDVDGKRLIDNTIIVLSGEVGNGSHDEYQKPHVVIGGGNRIKRQGQGRWYRTPTVTTKDVGSRTVDGSYMRIYDMWAQTGAVAQRSHADLFVKLGQLAGLNVTSFGIDKMNMGALDI
jgi:hypothetical protein